MMMIRSWFYELWNSPDKSIYQITMVVVVFQSTMFKDEFKYGNIEIFSLFFLIFFYNSLLKVNNDKMAIVLNYH